MPAQATVPQTGNTHGIGIDQNTVQLTRVRLCLAGYRCPQARDRKPDVAIGRQAMQDHRLAATEKTLEALIGRGAGIETLVEVLG